MELAGDPRDHDGRGEAVDFFFFLFLYGTLLGGLLVGVFAFLFSFSFFLFLCFGVFVLFSLTLPLGGGGGGGPSGGGWGGRPGGDYLFPASPFNFFSRGLRGWISTRFRVLAGSRKRRRSRTVPRATKELEGCQHLLEERFKLEVHHTTKDFPVYELTSQGRELKEYGL